MPKGRKQKKTVAKKKKKKKKSSTQKKKPIARKKRTGKPSLKSAAGKTALSAAAGDSPIEEDTFRMEDFVDVTQERTSIISIVKGLEGQVETAFKLKEVLEAELETTQKKLSEEMEARGQLEVQITSLQGQATLAEQLREDISFADEERNKFANLLTQIQPQLEEVTVERDLLAEQMASTEEIVKGLENDKMALEAQVMNLKDKITDDNRLHKELMETTEAHRGSREQVHDLTRRLEASEASKHALKKELAGTHKNARTSREEVEDLREKIANADSQTSDLRIQFEDQQAANRKLIETNTRLENEVKMANINYEAAKNELDTFKNALRDIRSEATRTSGRVRQRYLKLDNPSDSNQAPKTNSSRNRSRPLSSKA